MRAVEILKRDRDSLIECHTLHDKATGKPIMSTLDSDVAEDVAEYDAAIAEIEALSATSAVEADRLGDGRTDTAVSIVNRLADASGKDCDIESERLTIAFDRPGEAEAMFNDLIAWSGR